MSKVAQEATTKDGVWSSVQTLVDESRESRVLDLKEQARQLENSIEDRNHQEEKVVFGFPRMVEVEKDNSQEVETFLSLIKQENDKKEKTDDFARKLAEFDIHPLAILPTRLFKAISSKFGLYYFESMDQEGKAPVTIPSSGVLSITEPALNFVYLMPIGLIAFCVAWLCGAPLLMSISFLGLGMSVAVLSCGMDMEKKLLISLGALSCFAMGLIFCSSLEYFTGMHFIGFAVCSLILGIVGVILSMLLAAIPEILLGKIIEKFDQIFVCNLASQKRLLKIILPRGHDEIIKRDDHREPEQPWIHIRFPMVGRGFNIMLDNVIKHNLKPLIAASPNAIIFDYREVFDAMRNANKKQKEYFTWLKQHDYQRWLREDPILCVVSGDGENIAVLAQQGDFLDEKQVIEWIKQEGLALIEL